MADIAVETVFNVPGRATGWAWRNVTSADTCLPAAIPLLADKTVQVKPSKVGGAFGGATVHLKGSLEKTPDATDYDVLESAFSGAPLSFTGQDSKAIGQHMLWVVPELEGATGATKVDILVGAFGKGEG